MRYLVAALAFVCAGALAGDFATLPLTGAPVQGRNNQNTDPLYLSATSVTFLDTTDAPAGTVPSAIAYNALATSGSIPRAVTGSGVLTLLAYRFTRDISLQNQKIGHLYDFVFRDSRDGKLVFGTRAMLGVDPVNHVQNAEINFVFRLGFLEGATTFDAAAAWLRLSDSDLRLYNGSRTSSNSLTSAATFDANTVRLQSDINGSEGNPYSALMLVKTNAQFYKVGSSAVSIFQAGEEGQARVGSTYAGFVPTGTDPNVVPDPDPDPDPEPDPGAGAEPTFAASPPERNRTAGGKFLPRRGPGRTAVPLWRGLADAWVTQ